MNENTPSYLPPISLIAGILLTVIVTNIFPHNAKRWGASWVIGLAFLPLLSAIFAGWPTFGEYIWQVSRSTPVLWMGSVAAFEVLRAFDMIDWIDERTDALTRKLDAKLDRIVNKDKEQQE